MVTREVFEKREFEYLSPYAAKAAESRGRKLPEEKCSIRTDYQRDRDRIVHSKAFRRLMHKTQVFLAPEGDHYRTRLTHTIEVSQIARTIARGAGLNEDLTEAIAMGHDLGHTPFGHSGEAVLNEIYPGGFRHNVQSLRVVDVLESGSSRRGMNLTFEVRDGILNHTGSTMPVTAEGQVVKTSDRIAYINHDIDDAIRGGVLRAHDLPQRDIEILGDTHSKRINNLIRDLVENSQGKDEICQSPRFREALMDLRSFMF
ncbi:MAG: deoxyguanosinetriphosphate triphosphohydrolase, partial [Eubacteriales bacterium]|nr:deoxyguanosinetriphosphate triphosphohydrolase [Eubacteriales bacterium]